MCSSFFFERISWCYFGSTPKEPACELKDMHTKMFVAAGEGTQQANKPFQLNCRDFGGLDF